jgi:hypothetical protein
VVVGSDLARLVFGVVLVGPEIALVLFALGVRWLRSGRRASCVGPTYTDAVGGASHRSVINGRSRALFRGQSRHDLTAVHQHRGAAVQRVDEVRSAGIVGLPAA